MVKNVVVKNLAKEKVVIDFNFDLYTTYHHHNLYKLLYL